MRLPIRPACAAVAAVLAVVLVPGCGTTSTAPVGPSAAATTALSNQPRQTIRIRYQGGQLSGDTGRVPVRLGSPVALQVTSDTADEVHLHGYDKMVDVPAGGTATLSFVADVPGEQTVILASDPFGRGANLFGTARHVIDYTVLGTTTIALVQVGAIVVGHLLAVVSAHDRAVRFYPARVALRTQYPLVAAMVALTVSAVALVFAP